MGTARPRPLGELGPWAAAVCTPLPFDPRRVRRKRLGAPCPHRHSDEVGPRPPATATAAGSVHAPRSRSPGTQASARPPAAGRRRVCCSAAKRRGPAPARRATSSRPSDGAALCLCEALPRQDPPRGVQGASQCGQTPRGASSCLPAPPALETGVVPALRGHRAGQGPSPCPRRPLRGRSALWASQHPAWTPQGCTVLAVTFGHSTGGSLTVPKARSQARAGRSALARPRGPEALGAFLGAGALGGFLGGASPALPLSPPRCYFQWFQAGGVPVCPLRLHEQQRFTSQPSGLSRGRLATCQIAQRL